MRRLLLAVLLLAGLGLVVPERVPGAPAPAAAAALPVRPAVVVVRPGDTMRSIAARHGLSVRTLAWFNRVPTTYVPRPDGMLRVRTPGVLTPYYTRITGVTAAELGSLWKPGCPVGPASLRRVHLTYYGFDGHAHRGSLVVHKSIAVRTQRIFRSLYAMRFPVNSVGARPDFRVWPWNDTGSFICRKATNSSRWSEHAYGLSIDINPVQNPMVLRSGRVIAGDPAYVRRSYRPGVIHGGGAARAFTANGLKWGGYWSSSKDYMHFSLNGR